jgi:hypothetical protein
MAAEQLFLRLTTCSSEQRTSDLIAKREASLTLQPRRTAEHSNCSIPCSWIVYTIRCGTKCSSKSTVHPWCRSVLDTWCCSIVHSWCGRPNLHAWYTPVAHSRCHSLTSNKCTGGLLIDGPIIRSFTTAELCRGSFGSCVFYVSSDHTVRSNFFRRTNNSLECTVFGCPSGF